MKINYIKSIYITAILIMFTGCSKDYLDINQDPNNPTKVTVDKLLPRAEQYVAYSMGLSRGNNTDIGLSEVLSVYTHQVVVREVQDQYGATGTQFDIVGAWRSFYSNALPDLESIINQGTEDGNMVYVGIAKILKAYAFSQFVDTFGDIPFSEAGKFFTTGIQYPAFESGADIYPQLITLLDEGIADINSTATNASLPGSNDIIYNGSKTNWIKAANTIKLKMYTQLRLKQSVTAEVTALLSNPATLINTTAESFMYYYGTSSTPDDRNPGFNDYVATQKSHYQSPWFYEILKGYNPNIFTGITDPRIPYYFYRQLSTTATAQSPTEYRDGGFLSIVFGSIGPNRDFAQDGDMSVFGIYPVGGRYDDGAFTNVSGTNATGAAPFKFLTYADRLYLEAELINSGVITGDARTKLQQAMTESFKQVDYVVGKAKLSSQTVPVLATAPSVTNYMNLVLAQYDARSQAGKLEIIMTQKWIASFGSSVDQYTDYRRTGYPVLFDPNNANHAPGGFVQPPINGDPLAPGAQAKIQVQLSRDYPLSLPWSQDELSVNKNAPPQKQPGTFKVFWDN